MARPIPWLALLAGQAAIAATLMIVFVAIVSPDLGAAAEILATADTWITTGIGLVLAGALQAVVLLPLRRARARRHRGVSLWISLGLGVSMATLLLGGFTIAVLDALRTRPPDGDVLHAGIAVGVAAWVGGLVLVVASLRRDPGASREALVHHMAKRLLQGSAFEAVALVPFDVMIRRKTDCYCAAGTVLAWAICFAVGLVVLGPAVLLPALIRQRERWYRGRCEGCGLPFRLDDAHVAGYRGPIVDRCGGCSLEGPVRDRAART